MYSYCALVIEVFDRFRVYIPLTNHFALGTMENNSKDAAHACVAKGAMGESNQTKTGYLFVDLKRSMDYGF